MNSASRLFHDMIPFRAAWLPSLALSTIAFLGGRPASATSLTTSYIGSQCQPIGSSSTSGNSWNDFYISYDDGLVANNFGNNDDPHLWVVCPINKQTSGEGISFGDEISDVEVTINNGYGDGTGIYCQVVVYSSQVPTSADDTNIEDAASLQSEYTDGLISFSDGVGGSGWWGTTSWLYAQLECELQWGEELTSYEVTENGSATGQSIFPAMSLCSTLDSDHFQENIADLDEWGPAGFAEDPGGTRGSYSCVTPQDFIQYAMIPGNTSAGGVGWEWSYNSSGNGSPASWTCSSAPTGTAFAGINSVWPESFLFPSSTFSAPSADKTTKWTTSWIDTSTTNWNYFKQCTTDGDFGIVSARTTD
jgi:hypothetical protein